MIAGYFETLQGNVAPSGFIISTISPTYSMWDTYGIWDLWDTYSAVTVIPNFFLTGIMAILVSFLVIILLGITIFGVNDASLLDLLGVFAAAMFIPLLLMIFGGFAYNIRKETNLNKDTTYLR